MQKNPGLTQLIEREGRTVARRLRKVRLSVLDGADQGVTFEAAQDEIRVGSSDDNDLVLRDPSVSRRHLSLRLTADGIRVRDLGSTNGVFLNDMRVHDAVVGGGVELLVGATRVRVEALGETVEKDISAAIRFGRLVGASATMREVFAVLERVAPSDLTVLIEGEPGTGKELVADALHRHSARKGGAFTVFDCAAVPKDQIEVELFGVVGKREGQFQRSDGGTLFLAEVSELPGDVQAKLLRALDTKHIRPVGSPAPVPVDVRVVASTCRNLPREVKENRFRQDLYYRLAAVVVKLPPLRSRLEDVSLLIETAAEDINRHRAAQGLAALPGLDKRATDLLLQYDFPGNVRELRNLVERFSVFGPDPNALQNPEGVMSRAGGWEIRTDLPFHDAKEIWTDIFEKAYLTKLLQTHGHNVSAAARTSGIDRRHLQRLMVKHDLRERRDDD